MHATAYRPDIGGSANGTIGVVAVREGHLLSPWLAMIDGGRLGGKCSLTLTGDIYPGVARHCVASFPEMPNESISFLQI